MEYLRANYFNEGHFHHFGIPELEIQETRDYEKFRNFRFDITLRGNNLSPEFLGALSNLRYLNIQSFFLGMNLEYLDPKPSLITQGIEKLMSNSNWHEFPNEPVLCHIRGGDIWKKGPLRKVHPDYSALPISFYENIENYENRELRFLIEPQTNSNYIKLLIDRFGHDSILKNGTPKDDFAKLLEARILVTSISSFSWLGGFFGRANRIHIAEYGLFDKANRPDINLVPNSDEKWIVWKPQKHLWRGDHRDFPWISGGKTFLI